MSTSFREEMKQRTRKFSLRVIRLYSAIKNDSEEARVIGKQLLRSATSVGANYREACHARSRADFAAKLKICEGEAAESTYWLELLEDAKLVTTTKITPLRKESEELTAIFRAGTKHLFPDA